MYAGRICAHIPPTLWGTISALLPEMDPLSDIIGRQQYRGRVSLSLSVSTHRFTNANMHLCIYTWYRATSVHAYIYTETYHTNIMCSFYVDQNPKWRMLFKIGKSFRNKEIIYLIIWLYLYTLFRNLQISLVSFFLCFLSFMFLIFIKNISSV